MSSVALLESNGNPTEEEIRDVAEHLISSAIMTRHEQIVMRSILAKQGIATVRPSNAPDATFLIAAVILLGVPHDEGNKPLFAAIHYEFYDKEWETDEFIKRVAELKVEVDRQAVAKPAFDPDLSHLCESPIETAFYAACAVLHHERDNGFCVTPQHEIEPYRLDFSIQEYEIAIELDGHEYHKTKEQRTADAKRDRFFTSIGWTVLRFTGSEIHADVAGCALEVFTRWEECEKERRQLLADRAAKES